MTAETILTPVTTTETGAELAASYLVQTTSGGAKFLNDGQTLLLVVNAGTGTPYVTVTGQNPCEEGVTHDATGASNIAFSTPQDGVVIMGPFSTAHFNDSTGYCHVTFSTYATGTKAVALRMGVCID